MTYQILAVIRTNSVQSTSTLYSVVQRYALDVLHDVTRHVMTMLHLDLNIRWN